MTDNALAAIRRHFCILWLLLIPCCTYGFDYVYKGVQFKCKIKNGSAVITGFDVKATDVVIPAEVQDKGRSYPVKSVSTFLNGVNYLTIFLTLEEGIERIENYSFCEFRKLETITLPSTITYIGKNGIRNNELLTFNAKCAIDENALRSGREIWVNNNDTHYASTNNKKNDLITDKKDKKKNNAEQERDEFKKKLDEQERIIKEQQNLLAENAKKSQNSDKKIKSDNSGKKKKLGGLLSAFNIFSKKNKNENTSVKSETKQTHPTPASTPAPVTTPDIAATNNRLAQALPPVDVDINIPKNKTDRNKNTFCIIIANEKYEDVPEVEFASRDGEIFREYCVKTLGIPEKQIRTFINASYTDVKRALNWVETMAEVTDGQAKILFYYAGHGIPNEQDKTAYLIPTDGFPKDITTCFKLSDLYSRLGKTKSNSVTVLLDACFSGVQRGSNQTLVAARGVAIKPKDEVLPGKMVVFTAASNDETALAYKDKRHGMFTYFLLDKLKKSKGDMELGELFKTVQADVKKNSMLENDKLQTPSVIVSNSMKATWHKLTF